MESLHKKVCMLGGQGVGKTSLVRQFVFNLFDDKYISTIGVKVSRKTISVAAASAAHEITLMLWDIAGHEGFDHLRRSYLRGATGAILVCDLTRPESLPLLKTYAREIRAANPTVPLIVAANKADLLNGYRPDGLQQISAVDLEQCAAFLDAPLYLTSAKTGQEVETLFRHLGQLLAGQQS